MVGASPSVDRQVGQDGTSPALAPLVCSVPGPTPPWFLPNWARSFFASKQSAISSCACCGSLVCGVNLPSVQSARRSGKFPRVPAAPPATHMHRFPGSGPQRSADADTSGKGQTTNDRSPLQVRPAFCAGTAPSSPAQRAIVAGLRQPPTRRDRPGAVCGNAASGQSASTGRLAEIDVGIDNLDPPRC